MTFDPYRWETGDEQEMELLKTISNVPFGGPRICPGKYLSSFESTLFFVHVGNFFVRPAESKSQDVVGLVD